MFQTFITDPSSGESIKVQVDAEPCENGLYVEVMNGDEFLYSFEMKGTGKTSIRREVKHRAEFLRVMKRIQ